MVLYVTDYNLVAFTCVYDFIMNRVVVRHVQEFAICDVDSVEIVRLPLGSATRKQWYELPESSLGGEPIWRLSEDAYTSVYLITLTVASGQQIIINVAADDTLALAEVLGEPVKPNQLVKALRALVREYKRKMAADPDDGGELPDVVAMGPQRRAKPAGKESGAQDIETNDIETTVGEAAPMGA